MKLAYAISLMSLLGVFLVNSQRPSALPHRAACHRYYERHKQNLPQPYAGMILSQFVQTCIDRGGPSKLFKAAPTTKPAVPQPAATPKPVPAPSTSPAEPAPVQQTPSVTALPPEMVQSCKNMCSMPGATVCALGQTYVPCSQVPTS